MSKKQNTTRIVIPLIVGSVLILWPEPLTTATGLLIVAGSLGYKYI